MIYLCCRIECLYHNMIKVEGTGTMGRTSRFQRDSNSRATLLTGILLLFLFSNIISSSISQNTLFRAEGKPASISSLQEKN